MEDCAPEFSSWDPISELIITYNELNSPLAEELQEEPSPLEFMRYVARNTPFVVRKAASGWQASKHWDVSFLKETLVGQDVNVAVTPKGYVCARCFLFFSQERGFLPGMKGGIAPYSDHNSQSILHMCAKGVSSHYEADGRLKP